MPALCLTMIFLLLPLPHFNLVPMHPTHMVPTIVSNLFSTPAIKTGIMMPSLSPQAWILILPIRVSYLSIRPSLPSQTQITIQMDLLFRFWLITQSGSLIQRTSFMRITRTHMLLHTLPFLSLLGVGAPPRKRISRKGVLKDGLRERNLACVARSADASMRV